jgi:hypothetical protein
LKRAILPFAFSFGILLATPLRIGAVIVDRIAIRVENAIVKDSDIDRSIRVTEFLNDQPLHFNASERREAGKRLLDQAFIKREIQIGDYPQATWEEADQQLAALKKNRYKTDAAFNQALSRYGLVEPDLRFEFQWQLTVLQFVDLRFKPAVLVNDDEIAKYYSAHTAALRKANPGKTTLEQLTPSIRDILTGEKVNDQFFAWLDEQRQNKRVEYHEEGLQ